MDQLPHTVIMTTHPPDTNFEATFFLQKHGGAHPAKMVVLEMFGRLTRYWADIEKNGF